MLEAENRTYGLAPCAGRPPEGVGSGEGPEWQMNVFRFLD